MKFVCCFLMLTLTGCSRHLTERYAKVTIFGNETQLSELNQLGLPLDHITIYRDSAISGYFSYYDLKKVRRKGYRYTIIEKKVGKN